jgi:hypothetical protein
MPWLLSAILAISFSTSLAFAEDVVDAKHSRKLEEALQLVFLLVEVVCSLKSFVQTQTTS